MAALAATPPVSNAPVLLIHWPWQDPGAIAAAAGGRLVGSVLAPLATLAASDAPGFAARLRAAGAVAVRDGQSIALLCGATR